MEESKLIKRRNLEEITLDKEFEKSLKEEKPVHKCVLAMLTAAPVLLAINSASYYFNGDYSRAKIFGAGVIVTGALAMGAYKIYQYLHNNEYN
ncbi:MAG: hypothetical protein KAS15_05050 [Nanoarchaeota archaeon]|nr:hypothetical protein [Nanoarchaeota archaeon]